MNVRLLLTIASLTIIFTYFIIPIHASVLESDLILRHSIKNGTVQNMSIIDSTLNVVIVTSDNGRIVIDIPKSLLNTYDKNCNDIPFVVHLNGMPVTYLESTYRDSYRQILVNFTANTSELDIIASKSIAIKDLDCYKLTTYNDASQIGPCNTSLLVNDNALCYTGEQSPCPSHSFELDELCLIDKYSICGDDILKDNQCVSDTDTFRVDSPDFTSRSMLTDKTIIDPTLSDFRESGDSVGMIYTLSGFGLVGIIAIFFIIKKIKEKRK